MSIVEIILTNRKLRYTDRTDGHTHCIQTYADEKGGGEKWTHGISLV